VPPSWARLRREAIEEAHRTQGLTFTDIAAALGIAKGRVTQIRGGAPAPERLFFGVGLVSVGVPLREGTDDRMRNYVDAADLATQEDPATLLGTLASTAEPYIIPLDTTSLPDGDAVVILRTRDDVADLYILGDSPLHYGTDHTADTFTDDRLGAVARATSPASARATASTRSTTAPLSHSNTPNAPAATPRGLLDRRSQPGRSPSRPHPDPDTRGHHVGRARNRRRR
jgi:hypothetical protein